MGTVVRRTLSGDWSQSRDELCAAELGTADLVVVEYRDSSSKVTLYIFLM